MIDRQIQWVLRWATILVVCHGLIACSALKQVMDEPEGPVPESLPAEPVVTAPPQPEIQMPRNRVAILLSDDVASYTVIAQQITQRISNNDYITVNLDGAHAVSRADSQRISDFDPNQIIAIGLLAARIGRNYADIPLVFCQVFNYSDHDLITPTSRGVKFLPPFSLQIEIWKEISPDLQTVGIVTGPNQDDIVAEIESAAKAHQINLLVRTVASDKEALYAFKQLTPQIDGFWLLPDNRVLSPRVLREIITYGRKHGNQTVVFNPQLLNLGADISFSSRDADVADAVLKVLDSTARKRALQIPDMTSLTTLRAEFSPELSGALGGQKSAKLAQYLDTE